jgi:small subunit ribosomal protein S18
VKGLQEKYKENKMPITKKPSGHYNKDKAQGSSEGQTGGRPGGKFRKGMIARKKVCRFCTDKLEIDYKNANMLRAFTAENGKMLPGRATGVCAKHQRLLDTAIKRARMLAVLPFAQNQ